MKLILLNVLIGLSFLSYSQHTQPKRGEKWIRAGLFVSSIAFDAVSDGLCDNKQKMLSKSFKVASIGTLLVVPLFTTINKRKNFEYVLEFALMRYALFDDVYSVTRGYMPFTSYSGTTSVQDKLIRRVPTSLIVMSKFVSLGVAFHINDHIHHDRKVRKK